MAKCETCGNEYDKAFELTIAGQTHVFDSFECAIHAVAPICSHCNCRILGHGMEKDGALYCCAHCASESGVSEMRDRTESHYPARQTSPASPKESKAGTVKEGTFAGTKEKSPWKDTGSQGGGQN